MKRSNVLSPVNGKVWKIEAAPGTAVSLDDPIVILESMKMEIPVPATAAGKVVELFFAEGEEVREDDIVAVIES